MFRSVMRYLLFFMSVIPALTRAQCDVVAVVFDTTICQAELTLPNSKFDSKTLTPEKQHKIEKARLAQMIRNIAAQHLLPKGSYTPSEEEISSYADFLVKAKANQARQNKEIITTIEHLLKTYQYLEIHRKRLEDALATFQRSVEQSKRIQEGDILHDGDMRKRFGENAVKKLNMRIKKSRCRINKQWVARWKMNKALYEKYGGRIIFQQAGIEPIDAYRAQLRDIREKGGLKIPKPEYADVFSDFERYLDMGHNYLSENSDKYFNRPYWETADLDKNNQRTIDEYKAIPHK